MDPDAPVRCAAGALLVADNEDTQLIPLRDLPTPPAEALLFPPAAAPEDGERPPGAPDQAGSAEPAAEDGKGGGRILRKRRREPQDEEDEDQDVEGYAKLQGKIYSEDASQPPQEFVRVITHEWPVTLGRQCAETAGEGGGAFVDLGPSRFVSRNAARISFNRDSGGYELSPVGKNKVWVAGHLVGEGARVNLAWGDAVRIGRTCFYFQSPRFEKPKPAYAELAVDALRAAGPLGVRAIAQGLLHKHPYYNCKFGNSAGVGALARALQSAMSRSEQIVSAPAEKGRGVVYMLGSKPKPDAAVAVAAASGRDPGPGGGA
jgi:hypothetical protein